MEWTSMPITRRKRANPPDQPEENNNHLADQSENAVEAPAAEQPSEAPEQVTVEENANPVPPAVNRAENNAFQPIVPVAAPVANGDRVGRVDYAPQLKVGVVRLAENYSVALHSHRSPFLPCP